MLDSITKSLDGSGSQKAAEALVQKGLLSLQGKMYQQAMIQFQNAYKENAVYTGKVLNTEFNNYYGSGDYEGALSLGLTLIKARPDDYELANILGNCARKDENFKQANNLYRHALKIKKGYQFAFYNLAASMGKVEKYDDEVVQAIKKFGNIATFILPDFTEDAAVQANYEKLIIEFKEQEKETRIKELTETLEKLDQEDKVLEMRKVKADLRQAEIGKIIAKEDEIIEHFEQNIEKKKNSDDADEIKLLPNALFDMGLYCLSIRDGMKAYECFDEVRNLNVEIDYLTMCLALAKAQQGELADALEAFTKLLGIDGTNRYLNINMGLLYREEGNRLLSYKYLTIGAALLEKSEGLYKLSDLIDLAQESAEAGNHKRALNLYEVIAEEVTTVAPWISMGDIYLKMDKLEEAAIKYRKALTVEERNKEATEKLKEIHDIYYERGEAFFRESKYKASAGIFEKALGIMRIADTIKRTAGIYKMLRDSARYEDLMEEYELLLEKEKELEQEKLRQGYMVKGKAYMQRRQFNKAIENFELAFRMKLDKDVFMFLATMYKKLNYKDEMEDLLKRWNKMVEYDDRMKKYKKQEAAARRNYVPE
ncbi:MAG: hypothetical protein QNL04_05250 [SAR324 cluster bacterium]|nr:hypothetical protein [SAR324 cluster bacterium]